MEWFDGPRQNLFFPSPVPDESFGTLKNLIQGLGDDLHVYEMSKLPLVCHPMGS